MWVKLCLFVHCLYSISFALLKQDLQRTYLLTYLLTYLPICYSIIHLPFHSYLYCSTGIAKKLREKCPHIQIVGVDPEGSILAQPEPLNDAHRLEAYQVEGIGYDFIPNVLDRTVVTKWMKSNDKDSLVTMRQLMRHEGLLCGGSCGAAVSCALQAAKTLKKGQRCVVILPDSVRNYMSKSLSDEWMIDHGFVDNRIIKTKQFSAWWAKKRVCDLPNIESSTPLTITSDVTCRDAIALLKDEGFDMVPVLEEGHIMGVVTEGNMTNRLLSGRANGDESVKDAGVIFKTFHQFNMRDTLSAVANALDHDPFVLIVTEQRCFSGVSSVQPTVATTTSPTSTKVEPDNDQQTQKKQKMIADDGVVTDTNIKEADASTVTTMESTITGGLVAAGSKAVSRTFRRSHEVVKRSVVSGIVTRIDLLEYITAGENGNHSDE